MIKVDIGCGTRKQPEHIGIDILPFEGIDHQLNAGTEKLPFENDSVDEIYTSHFVEHLEAMERVHLINEAYRVLKPGGKMTIIVPHWGSCRAYGDLTHKFPPVSEFWFYYLKEEWRKENAPHNNFYTCNFEVTWGFNIRPDLQARATEHIQYALANYKEAAQDIVATLTKA